MATQEVKNKARKQLLRIVTDLLEGEDNMDMNFLSAQNLTKQALFKYLDLKDCPFQKQCRERFIDESELVDPEDYEPDYEDFRGDAHE